MNSPDQLAMEDSVRCVDERIKCSATFLRDAARKARLRIRRRRLVMARLHEPLKVTKHKHDATLDLKP